MGHGLPDGVVPTDQLVHPTPIYETVWMGLVALMLWHLRGRVSPQRLVAAYLVAAGLERFVVEFWRRNPTVDGTITLAQITALVSVGLGVAVLAVAARAPGARPDARPGWPPDARSRAHGLAPRPSGVC